MAHTYKQYEQDFRQNAADDGYVFTLRQMLSVVPAAVGYTIDTLLGLDNLFKVENKKVNPYDHFRGPFGLLLGLVPLLVGWGLGYLLEKISRVPEYLGYYLDRGISLLAERFMEKTPSPWNLPYFYEWMLGNTVLKFVAIIFYTVPLNQPLNTHMQGPFGFILGWGPAVASYIVNRVAAIASSLINYAVDHVADGVRFMYSGVSAGFKYLFRLGRKQQVGQAPEQTSSQLGEDAPKEEFTQAEPAPKVENNAAPANGRRRRPKITSEVDDEKQVEEKDEILQRLFDQEINIFASLGISPSEANNTAAINTAYRKLSIKFHSDKQGDKTDEEKAYAARRWIEINDAKSVLEDPIKCSVYMGYYQSNGFFAASSAPRSPVANPAPAATIPVANDYNASSSYATEVPKSFRRTKLT